MDPAAIRSTTSASPSDAGAAHGKLRLLCFAGLTLVLVLGFAGPLSSLAAYAYATELHSHILLVPFVSVYLLQLRRKELSSERSSSPAFAAPLLLVAAVLLLIPQPADWRDALSLRIVSFVVFVAGICFLCFGKAWVKSAAFPLAFLVFLVPVPGPLLAAAENVLTAGSVAAAESFFKLAGTPVYRDGQTLQLPGLVLEVARECSGIRSTLVLFITSLVATQLILKSPWRRALLVAAIIPLGIFRNGFRILVIGLLCVQRGPQMIDSVIHRKGGPLFFAISLIPLFLLAWWLRRGESKILQQNKSRPTGRGVISADPTPGTSGA